MVSLKLLIIISVNLVMLNGRVLDFAERVVTIVLQLLWPLAIFIYNSLVDFKEVVVVKRILHLANVQKICTTIRLVLHKWADRKN